MNADIEKQTHTKFKKLFYFIAPLEEEFNRMKKKKRSGIDNNKAFEKSILEEAKKQQR